MSTDLGNALIVISRWYQEGMLTDKERRKIEKDVRRNARLGRKKLMQ